MKGSAFLFAFLPLVAMAATPWEQFLDLPSAENAARVEAIDYDPPLEHGYDAQDLEILETQVRAADAQAFGLALRLYRQSDGGLREDLGVIVAKVIRSHPAFFLQQLSELNVRCSVVHWIVNTPGLEYVDRPAAAKYEIKERRKAIASVASKELATMRNECLKELEDL